MPWTFGLLAASLALLGYAVFQVVTAFTWSPARTSKRRRGPTYSPGETLWLMLGAGLIVALAAFAYW